MRHSDVPVCNNPAQNEDGTYVFCYNNTTGPTVLDEDVFRNAFPSGAQT